MTSLTRRLRNAVAALLAIASVACTSSYLQAGSPAELLSQHSRTSIQIGRKDGHIVTLFDPTIERDTLWGRSSEDQSVATSGVALRDIDWAMARGERAAAAKTTVVIGLLVLLALGAQGF